MMQEFLLTKNKSPCFFEELTTHTKNYKSASNWLTVNIKGYLNESATEIEQFPLAPKIIAEIIELVDSEVVSHSAAAKKLFPFLIENPTKEVKSSAEVLKLIQSNDTELVEQIVNEVLEAFSGKVEEYKSGKTGLLGLFVGECMKRGKGQLNPKKVNQTLQQKLS